MDQNNPSKQQENPAQKQENPPQNEKIYQSKYHEFLEKLLN